MTQISLKDAVENYEHPPNSSSCFWLHRIGEMAASGNREAEEYLLRVMSDVNYADDDRMVAYGHLYLNVSKPRKKTLVALEKFKAVMREQAEKERVDREKYQRATKEQGRRVNR